MRRKLTVLTGLTVFAMAQTGVVSHSPSGPIGHSFVHDRDVNGSFPSGVNSPRWNGRVLLGYDTGQQSGNYYSEVPRIYSVDKSGNREEFTLAIPGVKTMSIRALAGGADGTIAVTGVAYSTDAKATIYLARISPDRKSQVVTRIFPYAPEEIAIAGDGTIWAAGYLKNDADDKTLAHNLFRCFDTSGKQVSSFQVNTRRPMRGLLDAVESSWMVASSDRIGWFANSNEYLEFSLGGNEIRRFDGPAELTGDFGQIRGAGLSADSEVAVGVQMKDGLKVFTLDRSTRTWSAVLLEQRNSRGIAGFDGTTLITLPRLGLAGTMSRYDKVPVSIVKNWPGAYIGRQLDEISAVLGVPLPGVDK